MSPKRKVQILMALGGGWQPKAKSVEEGEATPRTVWLCLVGGFVLLFLALALSQ